MFPFAHHINKAMRAILNDWLIAVCRKYRLEEPVLFFAVDMADVYLLRNPCLPRQRYQLLGVVALMIASKVFGGHAPLPDQMSFVTDRAYTIDEVKAFELELMHVCRDACKGWGPFHFLSHFIAELGLSKRHLHAGSMLLECSTLVYELSRHTPGLLAAGACCCADRLLQAADGGVKQGLKARQTLGNHLSRLCGRDYNRILAVGKEICSALESFLSSSPKNAYGVALRRKYSSKEHLQVLEHIEKLLEKSTE